MSKYDPLWNYIADKKGTVLELSFDELREVLGFPIDHSFLNFKKELEQYGFRVRKIYLKDKKVEFEEFTEIADHT